MADTTAINVVITTTNPEVATAAINAANAAANGEPTSATPKSGPGFLGVAVRGLIGVGITVGSALVVKQVLEKYKDQQKKPTTDFHDEDATILE